MSRRSKTKRMHGRKRRRMVLRLLDAYGDVCAWCGRAMNGAATLDHVLPPRFGGGVRDVGNLVLAHRICNQRREYPAAFTGRRVA